MGSSSVPNKNDPALTFQQRHSRPFLYVDEVNQWSKLQKRGETRSQGKISIIPCFPQIVRNLSFQEHLLVRRQMLNMNLNTGFLKNLLRSSIFSLLKFCLIELTDQIYLLIETCIYLNCVPQKWNFIELLSCWWGLLYILSDNFEHYK